MNTRQGAASPQPKHIPPSVSTYLIEQIAAVMGYMPRTSEIAASALAEQGDPLGEEYTDWVPLENLLPAGRCADFMFMGSVNGIYLYKHVDSRRYLNVDIFGRAYAFNPETSNYDPVSREAALLAVQL